MIIVFSSLIVASKEISAPESLFSLSVISPSMFVSERFESSILRTASLKVMVIFEFTLTAAAPLAGDNVTVGAVVSTKGVPRLSS